MEQPAFTDDPGALFVLPPPACLRAKATWIVARNWVLGARARFGRAHVLTPEGKLTDDRLLDVINSRSPSVPVRHGLRRTVPQAARTLIRDAETWWRRNRYETGHPETVVVKTDLRFVWQHHSLFFRMGEQCARQLGAPLVQFVEALQVWESRRWGVKRPGWSNVLQSRGELPQLRAADVVACVSTDVADAVRCLGIPESRIVVTPNVADPSRFFPGDGTGARRSLGFAPDALVIGWIGSFRPFHGLEELVDAFSTLARDHARARLLLIGDGQQRARVEEMIGSLGMRERVRLTGELPYDEVPAMIRAMDVAVISSRSGDLAKYHYSPLKLREYLGCGVPVLAPAVGEIARDFCTSAGVLTYPCGDRVAMVRELARLLLDPSLRTSMASHLRPRTSSNASLCVSIDTIIDRLRALRASGSLSTVPLTLTVDHRARTGHTPG